MEGGREEEEKKAVSFRSLVDGGANYVVVISDSMFICSGSAVPTEC